MKKPPFFQHLLFLFSTLFIVNIAANAQITGNAGPVSLDPATETIVDPTIVVGGSTDLTDATVQISANFYNGDVLSFDAGLATSFGISGVYTTTDVSGVLTFSGTTSPANWQAIFRTITFQNTSAACGPSSRTINFLQGSFFYNSYNGHYYEFVNDNLNWKDAKTAAASRTFNGMQGYLATPTSPGENNFIWKLISADAWIGGSYDIDEINAATGTTTYPDQNSAIGEMYWVTGPERGTHVSSGLGTPVAQNGQYMNWAGGEPNNSGDEYYVELYSGNVGLWNDLNIYNSLGYLVEYGGMPGDVPQSNTFATSLTLTSTIGGDITGGNVSVCGGSNSTTLTTTAEVPGVTIVRWESSIDNFLTPGTVINNTTNTLTVDNLTETTYFRSIATGNSCAEAPSSSTKITVGNTLPGNLVAVNTSVCNNSVAQLTLSAFSGDILKWQTSTDNNTWNDIANTTPTYYTPQLTSGDYYFRVEVQSPSCTSSVFSNSVHITVSTDAGSVGGTVAGAQNACGAGNMGSLNVTGYTGNVQKWQSSIDNGATWTDIPNSAGDTYTFNDISTTTQYRAMVQNASCAPDPSSVLTVTYSPATNRWNGSVSTDFGDVNNWDCAVPGTGTNIVIGENAPNMPILDQDRTIGAITFENNTNININSHTLTVNGILSGANTGTFTGSSSSSLILAGTGNAGTLYFDQSSPGTSDVLNTLTINKIPEVVPTPSSTPVCSPYVYTWNTGIGITNVTIGSINNSTPSQNAYNNYFSSVSTTLDPSTDYNLSVTTDPVYGASQGIDVWIDWNNNGIFGDDPNEVIAYQVGGSPGTYSFTVSVPSIGGDITGGSKTMRVLVDDNYSIIFDGLDACYGEYGEFEDYKINLSPVPVSTGIVTLGSDVTVGNTLAFNKGIVVTGSNNLVLSAGSTVTGARDSSHVNGNVRKVGNTAFTFPVGNDTAYAPISISAPADIADHFTASYTKVDPLSIYTNNTYTGGLIGLSSNEYWLLERTNGSSNVAVTLSWDSSRSTPFTNLGTVTVAHWDGAQWTNAGRAGGTTGNLQLGTITSATVSGFSPFTIGISSGILPVNLVNFTAIKNHQAVDLTWQTSSEINSNRFEIERSNNGNAWIKIGEVKGKGNSTSLTDYSFTDGYPINGNNYYRLKQFDNDGRFVYSPVRVVYFNAGQGAGVYPNPFSSSITVDAGTRAIGDISIVDMTGKIVYRSRITKTKETINLSRLAAGQYTVIHNAEVFKIIKMQQ
ncbi:MAG: GEVED domain-containing protein [Bacteroidota bacterium]